MNLLRAYLAAPDPLRPRHLQASFPLQRAYALDPAKRIAAVCGRRSGKSYGNAARLVSAAERWPGEMSLYVAQTKNNARNIVGRALTRLSRACDLRLTMKEEDGRLMVLHPNGHKLWLAGARHKEAFEDFRGYYFAEVVVDEAQYHQGYLEEVVDDVLEGTVADLDGALVLSGTPSPIPAGYFWAVTTGAGRDRDGAVIPKWSNHHWTVAENAHFRNGRGQAYMDELRQRRGWDYAHPTFQREWLGLWVHDPNALVFDVHIGSGPDDPGRNGYWERPEGDWLYVVGVDLGTSENEPTTAFVVLGWRRRHPEVYVVEAYKRAGMFPSSIAVQLEQLREKYHPVGTVMDQGGLGGGYIKQFREWGLDVDEAKKADKRGRIELVRGDLWSGTLKLHPRLRDLLDEMALLEWDEDHLDVDPRFPDHLCDALIYAHGKVQAFYHPELVGPDPGSAEWLAEQSKKAKEDAARRVERRARSRGEKKWWG